MALSAQLAALASSQTTRNHGHVSLEKVGDGFSITKSHLDLVAKIPALTKRNSTPREAAETGCPFETLKAEISVSAQTCILSAFLRASLAIQCAHDSRSGAFAAGLAIFLIVIWTHSKPSSSAPSDA